MRIAFASLALLLLVCGTAMAEEKDRLVVADIATRFLAPAYSALATEAEANRAAWEGYCKDRAPERISSLQESHRHLALRFAPVQAFRFGPAGEGNLIERLYFWPERKGATAKGLAALLASGEPFTHEKIGRASAAAQGIPALERLAFAPPGETPPAARDGEEGRRACAAGIAIAGNVAEMTGGLAHAWGDPGSGIAARLAAGHLDPRLAQDMTQAASLLVTDFMTTLAVVQDQKIEPVLGATPDEAKPGIAEARLSGLTTPMILANLDGLVAFNAALEGAVGPLHRKSWDALLKRLRGEASAMQDFPDGVTDPEKRWTAEVFLSRLKAVRAVLSNDLPVMLGLKLGFNGLDGD
jgi:uncharacterized protein